MNPGVSTSPLASTVSLADSSTVPTATILPSRMPTSPAVAGAPVPSTMDAPRIRWSSMCRSPRLSVRDVEALQAVAIDRVASHQAVALVGVHVGLGEKIGGDSARIGPGAIAVRIVDLEQNALETDDVATAQAVQVVEDAAEHTAPHIGARRIR